MREFVRALVSAAVCASLVRASLHPYVHSSPLTPLLSLSLPGRQQTAGMVAVARITAVVDSVRQCGSGGGGGGRGDRLAAATVAAVGEGVVAAVVYSRLSSPLRASLVVKWRWW